MQYPRPSWERLGSLLGHLWRYPCESSTTYKSFMEINDFEDPGGVLGRLGGVLGPLGGVLGASWGVLGASWAVLGDSWGRLGASGGLVGRLGVVLVASGGRLESLLGHLRGFLGASWGFSGASREPRTLILGGFWEAFQMKFQSFSYRIFKNLNMS